MSVTYTIRHTTSFTYEHPVSESVMELRMRPATAAGQRCLQFEVDVQPRSRVFAYNDFLGNWVHHFDIPRRHGQLTVVTRSQVQLDDAEDLPETLALETWAEVDRWQETGAHWDFRQPSRFAAWSGPLLDLATAVTPSRAVDPLTLTRIVMAAIHGGFKYLPNSTQVDSPIDVALASHAGVCQDFSHIMIAVLRRAGLPARYVSGYIAPRGDAGTDLSAIATHAWVEVLLPEHGWIGVDPTHNVPAGVRHIRVAVGRDYADVPPTRGVFKGKTSSRLAVSVEVSRGEALPTLDRAELEHAWSAAAAPTEEDDRHERQQQQQQ